MILKYEVIKNGNVVQSGKAFSEEEVHEQLKPYYEHKTFGEPERTVQVLVTESTEESEAIYEERIIPAEYEVVITDITAETEAENARQADIQLGELIKRRAQKAIAKITGYNTSSGYSIEQVDQLEEEFEHIMRALDRNRIDKAQALIMDTEPTALISQELINDLLAILRGEL